MLVFVCQCICTAVVVYVCRFSLLALQVASEVGIRSFGFVNMIRYDGRLDTSFI